MIPGGDRHLRGALHGGYYATRVSAGADPRPGWQSHLPPQPATGASATDELLMSY
jgi:hypothetical protein